MDAPISWRWVDREINELTPRQALAIACCCCERLLPEYRRFAARSQWGDPGALRNALDVVWQIVAGDGMPDMVQLARLLNECELQIPDSDPYEASMFGPSAQDAVFATCSLIDYAIGGSRERAAWAAYYPTEILDYIVRDSVNSPPDTQSLEETIANHSLIQQEARRLRRDLSAAKAARTHEDFHSMLIQSKKEDIRD